MLVFNFSAIAQDSNVPTMHLTWYICYLHDVGAGCETDNCISWKLAMTVVLRCVPLCAGCKPGPHVFVHVFLMAASKGKLYFDGIKAWKSWKNFGTNQYFSDSQTTSHLC